MQNDAMLTLLQDLLAGARAHRQSLIITLAPGDRPTVRLACPLCGNLLARRVQGVGAISHRCTNRICPNNEPGAEPVRHVFVTME